MDLKSREFYLWRMEAWEKSHEVYKEEEEEEANE